jgi:transcriptional regulator with XRE-family HTH domain
MGRQKWTDELFGKRVRDERERQGWSQTKMAKLLTDKKIEPMYATTVAKIEAGSRSVRINEAVAIADLFEVPLDGLLGRKPGAERDLAYALGALMDAVYTSRTELHRTARSLRDRLEDIQSDFAEFDTLAGYGREVFSHLESAREALGKLEDQLIADMERQVVEGLKETKPTKKEPPE